MRLEWRLSAILAAAIIELACCFPAPCREGTFLDADSKFQSCLPCSECPTGQIAVSPCTSTSDTVCFKTVSSVRRKREEVPAESTQENDAGDKEAIGSDKTYEENDNAGADEGQSLTVVALPTEPTQTESSKTTVEAKDVGNKSPATTSTPDDTPDTAVPEETQNLKEESTAEPNAETPAATVAVQTTTLPVSEGPDIIEVTEADKEATTKVQEDPSAVDGKKIEETKTSPLPEVEAAADNPILTTEQPSNFDLTPTLPVGDKALGTTPNTDDANADASTTAESNIDDHQENAQPATTSVEPNPQTPTPQLAETTANQEPSPTPPEDNQGETTKEIPSPNIAVPAETTTSQPMLENDITTTQAATQSQDVDQQSTAAVLPQATTTEDSIPATTSATEDTTTIEDTTSNGESMETTTVQHESDTASIKSLDTTKSAPTKVTSGAETMEEIHGTVPSTVVILPDLDEGVERPVLLSVREDDVNDQVKQEGQAAKETKVIVENDQSDDTMVEELNVTKDGPMTNATERIPTLEELEANEKEGEEESEDGSGDADEHEEEDHDDHSDHHHHKDHDDHDAHTGAAHHGDSPEDRENKKRTAIIVGVAVGGVALFTLAFFTSRHCKKKRQSGSLKIDADGRNGDAQELAPLTSSHLEIRQEMEASNPNGLYRHGPKIGPPSPRMFRKNEGKFEFPQIHKEDQPRKLSLEVPGSAPLTTDLSQSLSDDDELGTSPREGLTTFAPKSSNTSAETSDSNSTKPNGV